MLSQEVCGGKKYVEPITMLHQQLTQIELTGDLSPGQLYVHLFIPLVTRNPRLQLFKSLV